ncbi:MAG: hypothetical protein GY792_22710 [Gammaproteobacteria bacterium]|nr:hypothetical protein [Gammaproteobacteria bacterium]
MAETLRVAFGSKYLSLGAFPLPQRCVTTSTVCLISECPVLDELKALTNQRVFDPSIGTLELTIAANDFQRDLIFPGSCCGWLKVQ